MILHTHDQVNWLVKHLQITNHSHLGLKQFDNVFKSRDGMFKSILQTKVLTEVEDLSQF